MSNSAGRLHGSLRHRYLAIAAIVITASAPCGNDVRAQASDDMRAMVDRMERLERDIRDLNLQLSRGTVPPPSNVEKKSQPAPTSVSKTPVEPVTGPAAARLAVRLTTLEDDVRTATGALEEIQFRLGEIRKRLDKLVGDVDYRLSALEGRVGGPPGQPPATPLVSAAPSPPPVEKVMPPAASGFAQPPGSLGVVSEKAVGAITPPPAKTAAAGAVRPAPPTPTPARAVPGAAHSTAATPAGAPKSAAVSVLPAGDVKQRYDFAFGLLRQAHYDQAEVALQEFVRLYPKEPLASNARYWLGETYYVRAAYVQAAEVFLEGYQADPKGPKAPDSLLKLGMSLASLEKKREACAAFDKLVKDFPNAPAGIKNTVTREKQKSGCS